MYALVLHVVGGFHNLAWAQRVTFVFLMYAIYINGWGFFQPSIDKPWRRLYLFKGVVASIAWLYYTLLIIGVVNTKSYTDLARWIQPFLISCMFTSAQLHKWEIKYLRQRKELNERLEELIEKEDDE